MILGKYDSETEALLKQVDAEAVMILVFGGNRGSGFSVSTTVPEFYKRVPEMLRFIAAAIEAKNRAASNS